LGNKNWIAEWMYQFAGAGKTYYEGIPIDTALMAVNDTRCDFCREKELEKRNGN
jgi:hypothetical protein